LGGGLRFGVPISDDESISYGLAVERTELGLQANPPNRLAQYVNVFGAKNNNLIGTVGWGRDTRDSAIFTTEGVVQRASAEVALPALDMRYYKLNYQHQLYYPVSRGVTLLLNAEAGVAGGYDNKPLPFFKNFYAGGPGSVRGFDPSSLGPQDASGAVLGGSRRAVAAAELFAPFPGAGKDTSVRLSGFLDAGAVYGAGDLPGSASLRYSIGAALTWFAPVGPLKFSYAIPLNKRPVDKVQRFQFTLGTLF
jgi:outer membrane protein insertion porin family